MQLQASFVCRFLSCIFQRFCYDPSISLLSSHVKMLMSLTALNLELSVAPSAPIIANYLLQPRATCRLASSNRTLLFSRQGCAAHQDSILIAWIFLAVTVFGSKLWRCIRRKRGDAQVLTKFCHMAWFTGACDTAYFLMCVHYMCMCTGPELYYIWREYYTAFL